MSAMRPGLPDPLLQLLGGGWSMGAPVVGAAWFGADSVGFGLADGTVAIARAAWEGSAHLQPRDGGGIELVPAAGPPPPVMRVGAHAGPCLSIQSDLAGAVLSGGADGTLVRIAADGEVQAIAQFAGARIDLVATGVDGALACATGRQVHSFGAAPAILDLPGIATALAFDPTGQHLAIGLPDGVTLWSGEQAEARRLGRPGTHRALAWSPDGQYLATGLEQNATHAWRVADGADIELGETKEAARSLSFSGPGGFLATSGGARVGCWDLAGGSRREAGVGSTSPVARVACHPNRTLIAAGYENGAVLLVQPDSTDILFIRSAGGGGVSALSWSADGAFLALATASGDIGVVAFPGLLFRAEAAAQQGSRA